LGINQGHPVSGGGSHTYGDLVLQVGDFAICRKSLSVKHNMSGNLKKSRKSRGDVGELHHKRRISEQN
jgi:hypothetical protein